MTEIEKFYKSFSQEIVSRQLASEDGDTQEQAFTRYVTEMLSDAGETENVDVAYDEKDLGTKKQHKINGYAIADNYETIDLFISVYKRAETIENIPKAEVDRAVTRITNFFRKAVYDDYYNDVYAYKINRTESYFEVAGSFIEEVRAETKKQHKSYFS